MGSGAPSPISILTPHHPSPVRTSLTKHLLCLPVPTLRYLCWPTQTQMRIARYIAPFVWSSNTLVLSFYFSSFSTLMVSSVPRSVAVHQSVARRLQFPGHQLPPRRSPLRSMMLQTAHRPRSSTLNSLKSRRHSKTRTRVMCSPVLVVPLRRLLPLSANSEMASVRALTHSQRK
jgi:hypothetical protein